MENHKNIPESGYARLKQIIGDNKAFPPIQGFIPVSKTTWWEGCKTGRFPKPIKLTKRTTVWRWSEIADLCRKIDQEASCESEVV